jgi:hypothetical protein
MCKEDQPETFGLIKGRFETTLRSPLSHDVADQPPHIPLRVLGLFPLSIFTSSPSVISPTVVKG